MISVNGVSESVSSGAAFPAANPMFQLVSLSNSSAKVSVVGGSYASGSQTLTLNVGKPVTLVNTADGTRYTIELMPQGTVATASSSGSSSGRASTTTTTTRRAKARGPVVPISPLVTARLRHEGGFGMLELLIAMVVLNVGLFALVGAFNASSVSIDRARYISAAVAVADRQMETTAGSTNCAIWLDQWLMPASGTTYANYTQGFNGTSSFTPQISYWNAGTAATAQSGRPTGWVCELLLAGEPRVVRVHRDGDLGDAAAHVDDGLAANLGSLARDAAVSSTNCSTTVSSTPCPVKPTRR